MAQRRTHFKSESEYSKLDYWIYYVQDVVEVKDASLTMVSVTEIRTAKNNSVELAYDMS